MDHVGFDIEEILTDSAVAGIDVGVACRIIVDTANTSQDGFCFHLPM
jgi:hypothetical protein